MFVIILIESYTVSDCSICNDNVNVLLNVHTHIVKIHNFKHPFRKPYTFLEVNCH